VQGVVSKATILTGDAQYAGGSLAIVDTVFSLTELPHRGKCVRGRSGYWRILHRPRFVTFYRVGEAKHWIEITITPSIWNFVNL